MFEESTSHPTKGKLGRITIESRSISDSNSEADLLPNQESNLLPNQIIKSESQVNRNTDKRDNGKRLEKVGKHRPRGLGQSRATSRWLGLSRATLRWLGGRATSGWLGHEPSHLKVARHSAGHPEVADSGPRWPTVARGGRQFPFCSHCPESL